MLTLTFDTSLIWTTVCACVCVHPKVSRTVWSVDRALNQGPEGLSSNPPQQLTSCVLRPSQCLLAFITCVLKEEIQLSHGLMILAGQTFWFSYISFLAPTQSLVIYSSISLLYLEPPVGLSLQRSGVHGFLGWRVWALEADNLGFELHFHSSTTMESASFLLWALISPSIKYIQGGGTD